ncbi:MAG TPA: PDZ domain-containing protein [Gemmatimonadales bacterium]|jgi:predicted metalloprotease with PDZ domain
MKRTVVTVVGLCLAGAGAASAQQQSRDQLERQLTELRQQIQDLQRQLRERDDRPTPPRAAPRAFTLAPTPNGGRIYVSDNKPKLGVSVNMERNAATDSIGASLEDVSSGGPAAEAGLKAGDIITKYNGETLVGRYPAADDDQSEPGAKLIDLAGRLKQGDTVKVEYRRGREAKTASVVARRLNDSFGYGLKVGGDEGPFAWGGMDPRALAGDPGELLRTFIFNGSDPWLDMETVSVNADLGEYFGTTKGLLVIRAPRDSSLSLKAGDVILAVDGRDVSSASQMYRVLRSYDSGETVKLDVMRQKRRITVSGKIPDRDSMQWNKVRRAPDERRGLEG